MASRTTTPREARAHSHKLRIGVRWRDTRWRRSHFAPLDASAACAIRREGASYFRIKTYHKSSEIVMLFHLAYITRGAAGCVNTSFTIHIPTSWLWRRINGPCLLLSPTRRGSGKECRHETSAARSSFTKDLRLRYSFIWSRSEPLEPARRPDRAAARYSLPSYLASVGGRRR